METSAQKRLLLVTLFFWFSMYTYVPTLAAYAQSLGAAYDLVGMIIGSYGLAQLLLRIPLGIFSDASGTRKFFILCGLALSAVSGLGMWLVPTTLALLVCRTLAGAAASTWVDFTVLFVSYFPISDAPKALGYLNAANNLGQVAAMLSGAYLAQHAGLQSPFLLGAVAAALGLAGAFSLFENRLPKKPVRTDTLREVFADVNLLRLSLLGIILQMVTYVTVFGFLPLAAKDLGASTFELGLLTTLTLTPSIFSSALSGSYFSRRFGERATLVSGLSLTALTCFAVPFISSLPALYLSQMIGGFARGLVLPLLMGMSIRTFPANKRSTAMGVFQSLYGLGMFFGPLLAGLLGTVAGLSSGFLATGLIGLAGAGLAARRTYLPTAK